MTDAVTAISLPSEPIQTLDTPEIADPDSVDRFEQVFNGEGIYISPLDGENIVKPPGFADQVMENIVSIDRDYQRLFPEGIDRKPKVSRVLDEASRSATDSSAPLGVDITALFKLVEETHAWGIGVMSWTTRLKLLTTTATTSSNGMSTLLKSGGG